MKDCVGAFRPKGLLSQAPTLTAVARLPRAADGTRTMAEPSRPHRGGKRPKES